MSHSSSHREQDQDAKYSQSGTLTGSPVKSESKILIEGLKRVSSLVVPGDSSSSINVSVTEKLDVTMDDFGREQVNQYTILNELGSGSFATVYKAKNMETN